MFFILVRIIALNSRCGSGSRFIFKLTDPYPYEITGSTDPIPGVQDWYLVGSLIFGLLDPELGNIGKTVAAFPQS